VQRQLRQMVDDIGLGPSLRKVRRSVLPTARRNQRDDQHLALLLAFVLREDSNCIDIGAHKGDVLRQMVRCAPRGRHMAFEPIPQMYDKLVTEFPMVEIRPTALSDVPGTSSFAHVVSRPAYSGLLQRLPEGTEEVETITVDVEVLDDVVPPGYSPTLIKIDVEGAEYKALKGAQRLLKASRPYVAFEFGAGSAPHYGTTPDDIYRLLDEDSGLHIYDMDGEGPFTLAAFREIYRTGRRFNFVAHA